MKPGQWISANEIEPQYFVQANLAALQSAGQKILVITELGVWDVVNPESWIFGGQYHAVRNELQYMVIDSPN